MKRLLLEMARWAEALKNTLPPRLEEWLMDVFFLYCPIWVVCQFWREADGYLKLHRPKKGQVVIDVGAWKGHFTLVASRLVGREGWVVAIEPQRDICHRLTIRLKRLGIKNVKVEHSALYSEEKEVVLTKRNDSSFNLFGTATGEAEVEQVRLISLDRLLGSLKLKSIDYVKMDIEGAELEALLGARETIRLHRPFFAIASYHRRDGEATSSRVEKILSSFGYSVKTGYKWHITTWGWYEKGESVR
jgi:FkbM family methyltransferase